jgi:hypothetical protein
LALGLPALHFLQTVIHEGSHALTGLAAGGSPKLAPFPHVSPSGAFRNGVTFGAGGFIATPQFVGLSLVVLLTLIFLLWPIRNRYVRLLLRWWFLGVSIDLLYNTARELVGGHNPLPDWSRFQDAFGIPEAGMIALTWLIWLTVWSHLVWVYLSAWHRVNVRPPTAGFWDYRGIAILYGALSLVAVVVSLAVSDPGIVKAHVAFLGPLLLLQVPSVVWHTVYVSRSIR